MLSKNEIKFINSLDKKRERDIHKLFVAEGEKLVFDLIRSGGKINQIVGLTSWISENLPFFETLKLNPIEISGSEMNRISALSSASPVMAIFHQPENFKRKSAHSSILILDDIRDPGNLGTIIRTADWFGIKTIICSPETVDCYNQKVIQSTMGSILRVNIIYCNLEDYILENKNKYTFYGTFMNGKSIKEMNYTTQSAIIIGNEAHGISKGVEQLIQHKIAIPGNQKADGIQGPESLNAAVATSIVLYDWFEKL